MLNAGLTEESSRDLALPKGIEDEDEDQVGVMGKKKTQKFRQREQERTKYKSRDWVRQKKERMRQQVPTTCYL